MTDQAPIDRVYEYGEGYRRCRTEVLSENKPKYICVVYSQWLLKYNVSREAESTTVNVSVDFVGRYIFSDQATLEVTVEAASNKVTETFDLEKTENKLFSVNLTSDFSEAKNEDLQVSCTLYSTRIQYSTKTIGTVALFTAASRPHDVVLVVGEKKFYVHKLYLATWSKYFDALFYGDFAEKDKQEVKLEDVDSTEFETLLHIIHPSVTIFLDDDNVLYLLKLADRFDMPSVMAMCGGHLMDFEKCKSLSIMERLELSDKYNLAHLQVTCLEKIHQKRPAEFTVFLEENRMKIRKLSHNTVNNLI